MRDLKSDGAKTLTDLAAQEKLNMSVVLLDVTDEASVKRAIAQVIKEAHRIDILVNNAGIMYLGPVESFTTEEIKIQHETNFYGPLRLIKEVIPIMRSQKSGRVINVTSINGLISFPLYGVYSSSKFGLETIMEALRFEVKPFGIKVSNIEPGVFSTNIWKSKKHPPIINQPDFPYQKLIKSLNQLDKKQSFNPNSLLSKLTHPQRVADKIYKVAGQSDPGLHNIVGFDAHFLHWLKSFLPESTWVWILHRVYNW